MRLLLSRYEILLTSLSSRVLPCRQPFYFGGADNREHQADGGGLQLSSYRQANEHSAQESI